jgi:hypothetical protein
MKSKIIQIVDTTRQGFSQTMLVLCEDGSIWSRSHNCYNSDPICVVKPFEAEEPYVNLELEQRFRPILNDLRLMRFVREITWKDNCILVKGNVDSILKYCETIQTFGYLNCSPLSRYAFEEKPDLVKIKLAD